MADVIDYVKGTRIDPVTGRPVQRVTAGSSGSPSDLTAAIPTSQGGYFAPGFGSNLDETIQLYPQDQNVFRLPATSNPNVTAKGGPAEGGATQTGQDAARATAKQTGQVTTFGNFLKALRTGATVIGAMGPLEGAAAQAAGLIDFTGDYGNYNQRAGWNDAFDAGIAEAKKKGIQDPTQQNAYAEQYARGVLPDPTTTPPQAGSDAANPGVGGANTKGGDTIGGSPSFTDNGDGSVGVSGYTITDGGGTSSGGGGTKGDGGGTKGSDAGDGSGGLGGVAGGSSGGATKGDFGGGNDHESGGGTKGGGSSSSSGGGSQAGRAGFQHGGYVIKDNPQGSNYPQQDKTMANETDHMMPMSARRNAMNRPGQKPSNGHWMQDATKNAHGQFRAKAQAAGMSTMAFAQLHKGDPGLLGQQARLAITLMTHGGGAQHRDTGGFVTSGPKYADGGFVEQQGGPGQNAPRPQGAPVPQTPAGGPGAGAVALPSDSGAASDPTNDGRFNPSPAQIADDGVTDNQPIEANEGEYVINDNSAKILGPDILNALNDPAHATEFRQLFDDIMSFGSGGSGMGGEPDADESGGPSDGSDAESGGMGMPMAGMPMPAGGGAPMPPGNPSPFPPKKKPGGASLSNFA